MKRIVSILLVSLMLVGTVFALAGCAKTLSGTYSREYEVMGQTYEVSYTFKGNKVEVKRELTVLGAVNTTEYAGTYEIAEKDDGSMTITLTFEKEGDDAQSGTYTFEQTDEYIKIGLSQYNKK